MRNQVYYAKVIAILCFGNIRYGNGDAFSKVLRDVTRSINFVDQFCHDSQTFLFHIHELKQFCWNIIFSTSYTFREIVLTSLISSSFIN